MAVEFGPGGSERVRAEGTGELTSYSGLGGLRVLILTT
jgi:hypothetical protein